MYYFAYCTWLNDPELRRYMPNAEFVAKGYAQNHLIRFHAAGEREDRGWCHLDDTGTAYGHQAHGVIFSHDPKHYEEDYDDFERCSLTVHGEDGKAYDCWTYRLITPGIAMRPPNFYWEHIPTGLKNWNLPEAYIQQVQKIYDDAAPCPRADRPNPSAIPGKSAATR
ncbi:gamma-glutamylcyclotransferase family protein [Brevibacillus centrosporus]|uniref:gamma-glutamylcyclotransferase family protein n=1 Tax=Brevibacillus centrosporus TaxID=54910 RepID=UPI002E21AE96|nr:gamma-glutamylcyclotransferase [Brevibacillus centrosporus]